MSTIAITGASGLLGQHLVERLLEEGYGVTAIVRREDVRFPSQVIVRVADVLDFMALSQAVSAADAVIHAAGLVSFNPRRRDEIFSVNVEGTHNLVNACLKEKIPSLVHISSVAALGKRPAILIKEEDPWLEMYVTDYARSKYLAELEAFRGGEEGLTVSIVNPSVILTGHAVHRSSGSLFDYAWKERPFYATGSLSYVDIRDVGDAVLKLLRVPQPGERITLCGGNVTYKAFFQAVAKLWNKRAPFIRIPSALVRIFGFVEELRGFVTRGEPVITRQSAPMTTRDFRYDTTKAKEKLGISFRDLDDTLTWCCKRYAQDLTINN